MAYERLIRKLMQLPKRPAVVLMQVIAVHWGCQHGNVCALLGRPISVQLQPCCTAHTASIINIIALSLVHY
jgi:hypothetical protein